MSEVLKRTKILQAAEEAINGQRDQAYGTPGDNFARIARGWTWYMRERGLLANESAMLPSDIALMMDLLKTARLVNDPSVLDGWIDKCGYSACGGEIATKG